jgi:putative ABC transport system ATP-binding protein
MIQLTGVSKWYQMGEVRVTALDKVSIEIGKGEFVVVLGPSGSGKTTLLNMIGALDGPSEGVIRINEKILSSTTRRERFAFRRATAGFIFQTFNLFPTLTALENVQFVLDVAKRDRVLSLSKGRVLSPSKGGVLSPSKDRVPSLSRDRVPSLSRDRDSRQIATQVLNDVGLGERLHHFPHQLSGGEQQRVAVARALAKEAPLILADEPTGELDFKTGVQILELLGKQSEKGKTIIIVTHNREIARVANRVIELHSGKIAGDGPPAGGKVPIAELEW